MATTERTSKRKHGRPTVRQGRLGRWLEQKGVNRAIAAAQLGIDRRHLDNLAREDRRPSLDLAVKIEQLTDGEIPVAYLATTAPSVCRRG